MDEILGSILDKIAGLRRDVNYLLRLGMVGGGTWQNYGASSSYGGFSAMTTTQLYYKRISNLVFVAFFIQGTSDATNFTFTLPLASIAGVNPIRVMCDVEDAGAFQAGAGMISLPQSSSQVTVYKTGAAGAWTASGEKAALGEIFYPTT